MALLSMRVPKSTYNVPNLHQMDNGKNYFFSRYPAAIILDFIDTGVYRKG